MPHATSAAPSYEHGGRAPARSRRHPTGTLRTKLPIVRIKSATHRVDPQFRALRHSKTPVEHVALVGCTCPIANLIRTIGPFAARHRPATPTAPLPGQNQPLIESASAATDSLPYDRLRNWVLRTARSARHYQSTRGQNGLCWYARSVLCRVDPFLLLHT